MGVYTEKLKITFSYIMIIYYIATDWSHTQLYHALGMISDKDFSRSFLINQIKSPAMPVLRGEKSTDCLLQTANGFFYLILLESMQ